MSRPANRASVLTPAAGRGAVAVVATVGSAAAAIVDACFGAANGRRLHEQPADRILFGQWVSGGQREEVIVVSGQDDSFEIHCHGGAAASGRIVAALMAGGCEIVPWQEWLETGDDGQVVAEATLALASATTLRAATILLDQHDGALVREVSVVHQDLTRGELTAVRRQLAVLLARSALGLHLTRPWQVTIAGPPNVGKSSLINALLGYQRSIVFDQPGTTRDVLAAETAIGGWPVRLTDAAGIRETADSLEAEGVARARRQLREADLAVWVVDASSLGVMTEAEVIAMAQQELAAEGGDLRGDASSALFVVNKVDLVSALPNDSAVEVVATSALTGAGIDSLLTAIARRLVPLPPAARAAVPFTERQVRLLEQALAHIDRSEAEAALSMLGRFP